MEAFATVEVIVMVVKLPYVGNRGRLDATYSMYIIVRPWIVLCTNILLCFQVVG